jgi:C1A family cysteine protease
MAFFRSLSFLAVVTPALSQSEDALQQMFAKFQQKFRVSFQTDEVDMRYIIFKNNVAMAYALNEEQGIKCADLFEDKTCVFGITKFAALSEEEFKQYHFGYRPSPNIRAVDIPVINASTFAAPSALVDWRQKGAVTPVKDQGSCGSCWAFSATEEIESALFMSTGKLIELSTQQIVACDTTDQGCNGGDPTTAYKYVEKAGGLDTAKDYPDTSSEGGVTGKCKWDKKESAEVKSFSFAVPACDSGACNHQDEDTLAKVLASKGPISICVNAGGEGWQLYQQGIYSRKCSPAASQLDHCVQLVGYNSAATKPYWIVRNSWAEDWGIDGYMHLEMGKNLCGVADEATLVDATTLGSIMDINV